MTSALAEPFENPVRDSFRTVPVKPFVGLRPYDARDAAIFYGRERDGQLLSDKIYANRFTLVFGQSGLGKSSLVRTLVIPDLQSDGALVLQYDGCGSDRPLDGLKSELAALVKGLGIEGPMRGSPTLVDLARLAIHASGRSLVLVLDQFEEYLVRHDDSAEPLRAELGALTRATGLDVHIAILLREEFLAALQPFRADIAGLFESTFRVEPLEEGGVREAIVEPLRYFGFEAEPALVDRLLADLRRSSDEPFADAGLVDAVGEAQKDAIDLPILQLVCSELWEKRGSRTTFDLALYEELGGASRILDAYVRRVMPSGWSDKLFTARLMVFLAPRSGLKMSYTCGDLVDQSDLPKPRVARELERLAQARILRTREFAGVKRYELHHDAFIRVLGPSRDRILRRWRLAKRLLVAFGVSFAMLLPMVLGVVAYFSMDVYKRTEGLLAELEYMTPSQRRAVVGARFESAASYYIYESTSSTRFADMRALLKKYEENLPSGYGINKDVESLVDQPGQRWPFEVEYAADRALDIDTFLVHWDRVAVRTTRDWGLPIPRRIRVKSNPALAPRSIIVRAYGHKDVRLELPHFEGLPAVSSRNLNDRGRPMFEALTDFKRIEIPGGEPWSSVPRWSLPAIRAAGGEPYAGSALTANVLGGWLLRHPETVLVRTVVQRLLERTANTPMGERATAAKAARGDRLAADLAALVKHGVRLTPFELILDSIANYPQLDSAELATAVGEDIWSTKPKLPVSLSGPLHSEPTSFDSAVAYSNPEDDQAFKQIEAWLPSPLPQLRIYLGAELYEALMPGGARSDQLKRELESFSDEFMQRYGLPAPSMVFWKETSNQRPTAFCVQAANETEDAPAAQSIDVGPGSALTEVMRVVRARSAAFRTRWIGVESWARDLSNSLSGWLLQHYSRNDIKLLRQAVIYPADEDDDSARQTNAKRTLSTSTENTLRRADWLFGSLVFWRLVEGDSDLRRLRDRLRQTQQRARFGLKSAPTASPETLVARVDAGIQAQARGNFDEAQREFEAALQMDPAAAPEVYIARYVEHGEERIRIGLETRCSNPANGDQLSSEERASLAESIDRRRFGTSDDGRIAQLCLLASLPRRSVLHGDLERTIVSRWPDPRSWIAEQASWFAMQVIDRTSDRELSQGGAAFALDFLASSFPRLEFSAAWGVFRRLDPRCAMPGPNNWCRSLMDRLASQRGEEPFRTLLAKRAAFGEKPTAIEPAIPVLQKGLERARASLAAAKDPSNQELRDSRDEIQLALATAYVGLAHLGNDNLEQGLGLLHSMRESARGQLRNQTILTESKALIDNGRADEAEAGIDAVLTSPPAWDYAYEQKFFASLMRGDFDQARETLDALDRNVGPTHAGFLFFDAILGILTREGDWQQPARKFLGTDHPYVNYIAMMLYSVLASGEDDTTRREAREVLERRWARADRNTWSQRLRAGDESAWREMLVGYFLDKVKSDEIFPILEHSDRYEHSDLSQIPLSREGLLTEAYFYDAMLAASKGDEQRFRARLQATVDVKFGRYIENKLARVFLAHPELQPFRKTAP